MNENIYHFDLPTYKEIRKIAYEFGYGFTMGTCKAMFIVSLGLGVAKAIKKYASRKITEEDKPAEE